MINIQEVTSLISKIQDSVTSSQQKADCFKRLSIALNPVRGELVETRRYPESPIAVTGTKDNILNLLVELGTRSLFKQDVQFVGIVRDNKLTSMHVETCCVKLMPCSMIPELGVWAEEVMPPYHSKYHALERSGKLSYLIGFNLVDAELSEEDAQFIRVLTSMYPDIIGLALEEHKGRTGMPDLDVTTGRYKEPEFMVKPSAATNIVLTPEQKAGAQALNRTQMFSVVTGEPVQFVEPAGLDKGLIDWGAVRGLRGHDTPDFRADMQQTQISQMEIRAYLEVQTGNTVYAADPDSSNMWGTCHQLAVEARDMLSMLCELHRQISVQDLTGSRIVVSGVTDHGGMSRVFIWLQKASYYKLAEQCTLDNLTQWLVSRVTVPVHKASLTGDESMEQISEVVEFGHVMLSMDIRGKTLGQVAYELVESHDIDCVDSEGAILVSDHSNIDLITVRVAGVK